MLKVDKGDSEKYFAVRRVLKIGGKKHIPSVCYPITDDIAKTVGELVDQKLAEVYLEKVRFISGRAVSPGATATVEEPRIVILPPKVQTGDAPEEAPTTSKAKKKTAGATEGSSSASPEGTGEFAPKALE